MIVFYNLWHNLATVQANIAKLINISEVEYVERNR
jgi:hypothetical protein